MVMIVLTPLTPPPPPKSTERWSNPLMGWTSTADPLSNAAMHFDSAEQAVRFAQRQGWPFEVTIIEYIIGIYIYICI